MTAEEKTALAQFLDLAGDYLGEGYRSPERGYSFTDDGPPAPGGGPEPAPLSRAASSRAGPDTLESIAAEIRACAACPLSRTRKNAVPGEGAEFPRVMVIGEGPGAEEDSSGRPFVGKAGRLLDDMLASRGQIGLYRDKNCFIANVVKCRPPGNRDPLPEETAACAPFLARQIKVLKPLLILTVGRIPTQTLLNTGEGIGKLRGRFYDYRVPGLDEPWIIPLLPTYHPSALLRNEELKRPAWEDLKILRAKISEIDPLFAASLARGS
jgi:DNA polymerase